MKSKETGGDFPLPPLGGSTQSANLMDRATGFYPVGCRFDSCRGRAPTVFEWWGRAIVMVVPGGIGKR